MNSAIFIAASAALADFIIAAFILARGLKNRVNVVFFILVCFIALWAVSLSVSNITRNLDLSIISARLTYGFSGLILSFAYMFVVLLGARSRKTQKSIVRSVIWVGIFSSPFFFGPLLYSATQIDNFHFGPAIYLYSIYLLSSILLMLNEVRNTLKFGTRLQKVQSKIVATSLALTIGGVGINNVLLPSLTGSDRVTMYSPLFSLIFSFVTAYSIIKHRLFDIRAVVARTVTYLFTTFFVTASYVVFAFGVKRLLLPDLHVSMPQFISNMVLTVLLVLIYPSIKLHFNRITNRLFYRDAYDPQHFLDELNNSLVKNSEINSLLHKTAQIIEKNLKSSFCSFYIRSTSYFSSRIIGEYHSSLKDEDLTEIDHLLPKIHKKIIHIEAPASSPEEEELMALMRKHDISMLARLVSALEFDVEGIGYVILGQKRSGNLYSKQDLAMVEIVANELVIAVENALRYEEIEQFNITLQRKIDTATKELRRSNEKLKALDEAKDEFISMASHQLRTPLTSVKGYLSMLDEGDAGTLNETQRKFVNQAFVSSQRMVYLIADLLNVSRLKTGKFIIEAHPTYLPDVVESEIAQLYETVKGRGLTMTFNKPPQFPMLSLDETKIRQVIMNFTDNAIYYTPAGGTITLDLKETPTSVEFTVTDSGIGVPRAEQHHLFTKFYRAGNARKTRPDGTGLGLFMAKKVVVAQGGAIIFKTKEGQGSTFGFTFNKEKLAVQPATAPAPDAPNSTPKK